MLIDSNYFKLLIWRFLSHCINVKRFNMKHIEIHSNYMFLNKYDNQTNFKPIDLKWRQVSVTFMDSNSFQE